MGRLLKGIFGGFYGKVGDLVGYTLNGKELIRTKGKSSKPPSIRQLAVRQKIKLLNTALRPMLPVLNIGFALATKGTDKNAFNQAVSDNFQEAFAGVYPDTSIDYSKLLISKGSLPSPYQASAHILPGGIEFTWSLNPLIKGNILNDRAMLLVVYLGTDGLPMPDTDPLYVLIGAQRRACRDFIELAPQYLDRPMVCYIAFAAEDGKRISNSVMAGYFL
jgi:hypothetical protein